VNAKIILVSVLGKPYQTIYNFALCAVGFQRHLQTSCIFEVEC